MTKWLNLIDDSLATAEWKIYIRESYIENLIKFAETKQVVVVQWQRRSGKSYTILWLIQKLWIKEKTFYFNRELDINKEIKNSSDLADLFDKYCAERWDPERIIIDEIQDIFERENFIRAKYVPKKYKIIISWSNAHLLWWELATYLTWRYLNFFVCPLWFDEYKEMMLQYNSAWDVSFLWYLESGGLPEIILINDNNLKKNYTNSVVNTIIVKDIMERWNIKNKNIWFLWNVMKYLSNVVWSIVSLRNIVWSIKTEQWISMSVPSLSSYIDDILASYIIHKVPRYNILWKQLFQQKDKYYFNDIWIRNSFWFDFNLDKWKLLENIVYLHLIRMWYEVYVWDVNGKEIDFVAKKRDDIHYLQVAWLLTDDIVDREFGNLSAIKDNYPKHVISVDVPWKSNSNGINIWNIETFIKEFK